MSIAPLTAAATLVDPRDQSLVLLDIAELRALEREAAATLPPHTLMARAGKAAAQCLLDHIARDGSVSATRPVWLAAGPGNNGGDALVTATELHRQGVPVELHLPVEAKPDDARWALGEARAAGVPIAAAAPASFDHYGWLVDGLFGVGLKRSLEGDFAALAERLSHHSREHGRVLALDVPSGLDSATGNPAGGGPAVHASHTVTFLGAKPGLYMGTGRDLSGVLVVAPLGIEAALRPRREDSARLNAPACFAAHLPARAFATNKGSFGSLAVIGGDTGMCGAPILAARASLYLGAGKVHVGFVGDGAPAYDAPHPELMLHAAGDLALDKLDALSLGCGMGQREPAARLLRGALALDLPKLLDADALNLISADAALADAVAASGRRGHPCVLTPHPLEAARLLDSDTHGVQADRLAAARELARRYAGVIVLKGAGTVIAAPDGRLAVNPTGNAALATGGTGDVLGGMIGALLAQRLPPYEAALAGVYLHGLAAEALCADGDGPAGVTASELAPAARRLLNRLFYAARG